MYLCTWWCFASIHWSWAPCTRIRFHLKTQLPLYGYGFSPHGTFPKRSPEWNSFDNAVFVCTRTFRKRWRHTIGSNPLCGIIMENTQASSICNRVTTEQFKSFRYKSIHHIRMDGLNDAKTLRVDANCFDNREKRRVIKRIRGDGSLVFSEKPWF